MITINTKTISETDARMIGLVFADAVKAFFADPVNQKEFNEFMERRKKNDLQFCKDDGKSRT